MKYLSDSVMLDTLNKVQALQASILKAGYSAHIDANVHQNWMETGRHISFELVIFEDNEIIRSFEFSPSDPDGVLNATYDLAVACVNYLQNV
jgi:hypothetical protein